jgi:hypothetical protein
VGDDVSRATKGITTATMLSREAVAFTVIVAIMQSKAIIATMRSKVIVVTV